MNSPERFFDDAPSVQDWDERLAWFVGQEEQAARAGAALVNEQAAAFLIELRRTFCVGAWAASVILCAAVLEAQQHQAKDEGHRFVKHKDDAWLKIWRNRLLHGTPGDPALTLQGLWLEQDDWQRRAKRAVLVALASVYARKDA